MTPNDPCFLVFIPLGSPLTLYQVWSMWPVAYSGNDGVQILRLAHKRHWHLHLDLLEHFLGKASCHFTRIIKQLYGHGPHSEELRSCANSHHQVFSHVKK